MMEEDGSSEEAASALLMADPYYRKYMALKRRCQCVSQENQRLVGRVCQVRRLVRRARRQCHLVAARLDQHGDDYRQAALRSAAVERGGGAEMSRPRVVEPVEKPTPKARPKPEKRPKRQLNEPKRPSNPFFQYCQEQRGPMLSQMKGENPSGLSKSAVTKQLAENWSRMSTEHKQKYVDRYQRDKVQYALAMKQLQSGGPQVSGAGPP